MTKINSSKLRSVCAHTLSRQVYQAGEKLKKRWEEKRKNIHYKGENNSYICKKHKWMNVRRDRNCVNKYMEIKVGSTEGGKRDIPQNFVFLPTSPAASPLSVKLFRATSAARLIKFSFLQITIRKRRRATESQNHYKIHGCLSLLRG